MAYLATLAVAMIVMWWVILIGGNPYSIRNIGAVDSLGEMQSMFRPGDVVGIRREVCSIAEVGAQFFPALKSEDGYLFPLPGGLVLSKPGCQHTISGFILPDLPAGKYTYVNVVRFQNNLVGRDEYAVFPPIEIEVVK